MGQWGAQPPNLLPLGPVDPLILRRGLWILCCDPERSSAFRRIISTEERGVRVCWAYSIKKATQTLIMDGVLYSTIDEGHYTICDK